MDYKEVRAYAWAPQKSWNLPYAEILRADFWMFSTGAAAVGVPLADIYYPDEGRVIWFASFADPIPNEWLIRPDMSFAPGVINKDGALLNAKQVSRLLKAESRRFQPRGRAGCYLPHNAFVFYDAEKKPVAFLEICFDCIGARAIPEDPGFDPDYYALAVLCTELKLPLGFKNKTANLVRDRFQWSIDPSKVPRKRTRRPMSPMPQIPGLEVGR